METNFKLPGGLMALAAVVLLGGMAVGYQATQTPITLVVDGESRSLRTHQETVGAFLLDLGLHLYPQDTVEPGRDQPLQPGLTIRVDSARPVLIHADGQTWQIRTHAATLDQILAEADVSLAPHDQVDVESDPPASANPTLHVRVRRAVPVTVHEGGQELTIYTVANTVGRALADAGFTLYLADQVEPGLDQPLSAGMHIYVARSQPATVHVDGRTIRTRTHRDQVGPLLADLGIALTGQDYAVPPLDAPLRGDTAIDVVRVTERFIVQQRPIPFDIVWQPDPTLELDQQQLLQDGANGVMERRLRVRYENGQEVSRTQESEFVAVPPDTKINGYGTNIVVRQLETPEGVVEYWRVIRMLATSYSASTAGTSPSSPWYGHTRLGWQMRKGIVAVDPDVIPLLTKVYVPGYGIGVAADTGGAINGKHIDLGYDDDNLVLWYRRVDVYILTPVPPADQINYTIN